VIVIDELDRLDDMSLTLLADTIKTLACHLSKPAAQGGN
jgi:hypothetical protein